MKPASPAATLAALEVLPDRLAKEKARRGWSYRELSEQVGLPFGTLHKFVHREHEPRLETVKAVLRWLAS